MAERHAILVVIVKRYAVIVGMTMTVRMTMGVTVRVTPELPGPVFVMVVVMLFCPFVYVRLPLHFSHPLVGREFTPSLSTIKEGKGTAPKDLHGRTNNVAPIFILLPGTSLKMDATHILNPLTPFYSPKRGYLSGIFR